MAQKYPLRLLGSHSGRSCFEYSKTHWVLSFPSQPHSLNTFREWVPPSAKASSPACYFRWFGELHAFAPASQIRCTYRGVRFALFSLSSRKHGDGGTISAWPSPSKTVSQLRIPSRAITCAMVLPRRIGGEVDDNPNISGQRIDCRILLLVKHGVQNEILL